MYKRTIIGLSIFLLAILTLRLAAPAIIQSHINRILAKTPGIAGTVGDVDLALIKGAYKIESVDIRQEGDKSIPLLEVEEVRLSILWSSLLQGDLVASIELYRPTISLFDRPQNKVIQSKAVLDDKTWLGLAKNLTPIQIDRLQVEDGTFFLEAKNSQKATRFDITHVTLDAQNISNKTSKPRFANAKMTGRVQGQATMTLDAEFDPMTTAPTFDLDLKMNKLKLAHIDELTKFYAPFDFEAGEIELASELKATNGEVEGYVKFGVFDLDIFSWHEDVVKDSDNLLTLLLEGAGGLLSSLFENPKKDFVATKVPVTGTLKNPELSTLKALGGVITNAFFKAYDLDIENSLNGLSDEESTSTD